MLRATQPQIGPFRTPNPKTSQKMVSMKIVHTSVTFLYFVFATMSKNHFKSCSHTKKYTESVSDIQNNSLL